MTTFRPDKSWLKYKMTGNTNHNNLEGAMGQVESLVGNISNKDQDEKLNVDRLNTTEDLSQFKCVDLENNDHSIKFLEESHNHKELKEYNSLSELKHIREKELKDAGLLLGETKLIMKESYFLKNRPSPRESRKSNIHRLIKREKETARQTFGLLKKPDSLMPRYLSTNYIEFPMIKSKEELVEYRKKSALESLKKLKEKPKMTEIEEDKKSSQNQNIFNYKQRFQELKTKDFEHISALFSKQEPNKDLPKFKDFFKEYWLFNRSPDSPEIKTDRNMTPSVTPPRFRSQSPDLPAKITQHYPFLGQKSPIITERLTFSPPKLNRFTETFIKLNSKSPQITRADKSRSKSPIISCKPSLVRSKGFKS